MNVLLLVLCAVMVRAAARSSRWAALHARAVPAARVHAWPVGVAWRWRSRRDRELELALPHVLDAIARSLRSGASLRQAVQESAAATTGALGEELAVIAATVDAGGTLDDALAAWASARPTRGVRLAAAALALGVETGGATAQAIDGVAATLRTNLAIEGEVRALSAQARLSALVIVLAPLGFSLFASTADTAAAAFLFATPIGVLCLAVGLGLEAVGWLWMRRIVAAVSV